jgi:creatinine deaminase
MKTLLNKQTEKSEAVFNAIAHMPTRSLPVLMDNDFARAMTDADFMRVAVLLAQKSYDEGGCPIGAVIMDNATRQIVGKGHNTLVQEDHPYNHGETSAIRDAGRIDFNKTTLFTSLSPCAVCASLIYMRGFSRVVVGDVSNAGGNEALLQAKGVHVDILEDRQGVELYARYRAEKPEQDLEDWQGLSAVHKQHNQ